MGLEEPHTQLEQTLAHPKSQLLQKMLCISMVAFVTGRWTTGISVLAFAISVFK